jgi:uridylate kinase
LTIRERIRQGWNAFIDNQPRFHYTGFQTEPRNPQRTRIAVGTERSIILAVLTRMAIDVASLTYRHVRVDENGLYQETMDTTLNRALGISANLDQTGRALIQDVAMSLFDEGYVAIVPTLTDDDPECGSESWNVKELRVGKITGWRPFGVDVALYNSETGQSITLPFKKTTVAIIQNPWYNIMNESNSTYRRLRQKLNLLDRVDEATGSSKLDILIQLPYDIGRPLKKDQAEQRKNDIVEQLKNSEYGIAYIGATERITQLNRPAENNLLAQIQDLRKQFMDQLGMTDSIMNGTADETTMKNYFARMLGPVAQAITEECTRKYLSQNSRSRGERVMYFSDPFAFTTSSGIADISDKLTRNAILSTNEVRGALMYKPSKDPDADALRNKNLNPPTEEKQVNETITVEKEAT